VIRFTLGNEHNPSDPFGRVVITIDGDAVTLEHYSRAGDATYTADLGPGVAAEITAALDEGRETLGITPLDGQPSEILTMPEDSLFPFLLALSLTLTFYGLLASAWALAIAGGVLVLLMIIGWLWPTDVTAEG
jgi:hypothetical protein